MPYFRKQNRTEIEVNDNCAEYALSLGWEPIGSPEEEAAKAAAEAEAKKLAEETAKKEEADKKAAAEAKKAAK